MFFIIASLLWLHSCICSNFILTSFLQPHSYVYYSTITMFKYLLDLIWFHSFLDWYFPLPLFCAILKVSSSYLILLSKALTFIIIVIIIVCLFDLFVVFIIVWMICTCWSMFVSFYACFWLLNMFIYWFFWYVDQWTCLLFVVCKVPLTLILKNKIAPLNYLVVLLAHILIT